MEFLGKKEKPSIDNIEQNEQIYENLSQKSNTKYLKTEKNNDLTYNEVNNTHRVTLYWDEDQDNSAEKNQIRYIGEYMNSKRNGFGKEYRKNGNLWYVGLWKDDSPNG